MGEGGCGQTGNRTFQDRCDKTVEGTKDDRVGWTREENMEECCDKSGERKIVTKLLRSLLRI